MQIDWDELITVARSFYAVYRAAEDFHAWQDEIWAERHDRIGNECAGPLTDADIDEALDQVATEARLAELSAKLDGAGKTVLQQLSEDMAKAEADTRVYWAAQAERSESVAKLVGLRDDLRRSAGL